MCKCINRVIGGRSEVGRSFFVTDFVPYPRDRRHVHDAFDAHEENSKRIRFDPAADFICTQQPREFGRRFAVDLTCDALLNE